MIYINTVSKVKEGVREGKIENHPGVVSRDGKG
jgi:hypothetical protein